MKRLSNALLAFCLACGIAAPASAATFSAHGAVTMQGQIANNISDFNSDANNNNYMGVDVPFTVTQRIEIAFAWIHSDALRGQLTARVPQNGTWGNGDDFGAHNRFFITEGYLNWKPANLGLDISVGQIGFALPAYMGIVNPVFDDYQTGVAISYPINDMLSINFDFIRLETASAETFDSGYVSSGTHGTQRSYDMLNLVLPIGLQGIDITPWVSVAHLEKGRTIATAYELGAASIGSGTFAPVADLNVNRFAYFGGLTTKFQLVDNLVFGVDAMYTGTDMKSGERSLFVDPTTYTYDVSTKGGFLVDAYASYELPMLTVGANAWYASGDTIDMDKNEITFAAPLSNNHGWGSNNSALFDSTGGILYNYGLGTPAGTMGGGLNVYSSALVDKLNLGAEVMYVMGTHEYISGGESISQDNLSFLTKKDSVLELNLNASYDIFEEFQATITGNYIIPMFDSQTETDNAFLCGIGIKYTF